MTANESRYHDLCDKAKAAIAAGDWDKVIQLCAAAIALDPDCDDAYYIRSIASTFRVDHDRKRANFDKAQAAFYAHNYDEAIQLYTEAIALDSYDSDTYFWRSEAYCAKGDLDREIADLDRAVRFGLDDKGFYLFIRGISYYDKGVYDKAITDFTKAIELDPDDAASYEKRGNAYAEEGDYDKAIADFEHALKLEPDYESAKDGLAEAKRKRDIQRGDA